MSTYSEQEDALRLHEYGLRMRAAWAEQQVEFEKHFAAFQDEVRDEWDREHMAIEEPVIDAPVIEAPKVEGPEIGPPKKDTHDLSEPDR